MPIIFPTQEGFTEADFEADPILKFFRYTNQPCILHPLHKPFTELAIHIIRVRPRNAERSVALRKLLEAQEAAIRASCE